MPLVLGVLMDVTHLAMCAMAVDRNEVPSLNSVSHDCQVSTEVCVLC